MTASRHTHWRSLPLLVVVALALATSAGSASPPGASSRSSDAAAVAEAKQRVVTTARQRVSQPLWLQEAAAQRSGQAPPANSSPAQSGAPSSVMAAPYILLQRSQTIKHTHRITARSATAVRIASQGMRGGVVNRVQLASTGDSATLTVKVPDGNEYLGVGVFAWDLDAQTNIDISLSYQGEAITDSHNPAGLDDYLEAPDGLMPGEYTITINATDISKPVSVPVYTWVINEANGRAVIATALPVLVSPNPVQLTGAPGCCSVELSVGDIQLANSPVSRYVAVLRYTQPDGRQLPGAAPTVIYLL